MIVEEYAVSSESWNAGRVCLGHALQRVRWPVPVTAAGKGPAGGAQAACGSGSGARPAGRRPRPGLPEAALRGRARVLSGSGPALTAPSARPWAGPRPSAESRPLGQVLPGLFAS